MKQQMYNMGTPTALLKFIADLFEIENDILKPDTKKAPEQIIVFSDFKIEWNPEFSNNKVLAAQ